MSANWTDGYVTDIGYTHGYYPQLNPARLQLAFAAVGLDSPEVRTACELGFGQGLSVNIHAAASSVAWYGNDFNPAQASHARMLAQVAGGGAQLQQASFAEFCAREDLPQFDFIAMHGIWSWVSAENRAIIRDFVERRLKIGGVLYVSYNTQPGWAAFMPLRDLLLRHFDMPSNAGKGSAERIDAALEFAERMFAANPVYVQANPFMQERLELLKKQSRHYLAHEYFNRHWHVEAFADMAAIWADAGLEFACSADLRDYLDIANLTAAQREFCAAVEDRHLRQSVRDFMVNQQFRRDYWVRGAQPLDPAGHQATLAAQRVVLLNTPGKIPMTQKTVSAEITLNRHIYDPIIDVLADLQPHSLGEIAGIVGSRNLGLQQVLEAMMMLIGSGQAAPVQDETGKSAGGNGCAALNRHLIGQAAGSNADGDIEHLASPVTGGGVPADRIQQLFMLAVLEQQQTPVEIVDFVWRRISAQGKMLVKDGVRLEDAQANLDELTEQATRFFVERLPLLQALQVI
ncbi:class I SAM-dependent methyltransferase [Herbaspirillum sp. RV1423]|uniref:class I SAM-dependent methyltransferase n=1 Tax=Herbaspirillum sp. RV1423 TaxID=1443993 RepID=UPI0005568D22|nr:class I SAM-dependent methyltransferase [Herbaspirillum sp. RV1423]